MGRSLGNISRAIDTPELKVGGQSLLWGRLLSSRYQAAADAVESYSRVRIRPN
jgi:hypothetical protein